MMLALHSGVASRKSSSCVRKSNSSFSRRAMDLAVEESALAEQDVFRLKSFLLKSGIKRKGKILIQ